MMLSFLRSILTAKCEKSLLSKNIQPECWPFLKSDAQACAVSVNASILYLVCVCTLFDGDVDACVFLYSLSRKQDIKKSAYSMCCSLATWRSETHCWFKQKALCLSKSTRQNPLKDNTGGSVWCSYTIHSVAEWGKIMKLLHLEEATKKVCQRHINTSCPLQWVSV